MDEKFTVEFYETEKGERPSLDFINTLEVKLRAKVFRDLKLLEEKGNELRLPYSENLGDGIFELRTIQGNNREGIQKTEVQNDIDRSIKRTA